MSTLLYNGVIRTMAGTTVSALVVKNGRIVYAGSDSGALAFGAESTLDLEGRCVLPGFVDSHTHILLRSSTTALI
jgi:predicted amidohydrolase YtcJ